jgi:hypothetical protein
MRIAALAFSGLLSTALLSPIAAQAPAQQEPQRQALQEPSAFAGIADPAQRSRAIFGEIGKVLMHPRCMNCHPAGDRPLQGADHRIHWPPAKRAGLGDTCAACHTDRNVTLHARASYQSIPGQARWELAPLSMAWEGKSIGEICRQLKDKERNGGRDLALLHEHIAKDELVAWGWDPGEGREPAPGNQDITGKLVQAWIDSGAECP